jgi:hypothetical protein
MEEPLYEKDEAWGVRLWIVKQKFLSNRFLRRARLERLLQITGGHLVKAISLQSEALAQSTRWKREKRTHGPYPQLKERIAEVRL